jgi:ubiquinone/menaquinone biosynthesis C-methylase UbiE
LPNKARNRQSQLDRWAEFVKRIGRLTYLSYRVKLLAFVIGAVMVLVTFNVGYSALNTLSRLDVVEAERDQWQRPSDVIRALDLKPGNVVVDLGCGAGYFTLKLSSPVGNRGRVIAEDIRRLPLVFLWFRTLFKSEHNVSIIHGKTTNPDLPIGGVNAVLIVNTYHELTDAQTVLAHVGQSLVSGGRLVVADREPNAANIGVTEMGGHEITAERAENELRRSNFEIVDRRDHFIDNDPDHEIWWLIVARKR